jgi:carbon-monoxide dehydrogenase medium subunit
MRPIPKFQYHSPESLNEALSLLAELENASPVIGGSDLMIAMRNGVSVPSDVVDLNEIPELNFVKEEDGIISIGATATHTQVANNPLVARIQSLVDSVSKIGSPQIRNRGTITGNVCNASPAADSAPPLLVHMAEVKIQSLNSKRIIPITDLFAGPKINSLETGELVTEIRIPVPPNGAASSFKRIGRRKAFTLSVVSSAAYILMDGEICTDAKVAFGSVAITPVRVPKAESLLIGSKLDEGTVKATSDTVHEAVKPITDVRGTADYRKDMCPVLMRRAIDQCLERLR